jgi:hypothetical protein
MPSFRAKARAIDLLGKGQIADLPTAISELWKNGYDAYAETLSCSLYLTGYEGTTHSVFTLSDDGIGMSRSDLEERWIVLGTDSKVRGSSPVPETRRLGKPVRTPMGEKGIGRLSVSYLGSRMLMLTKPIDGPCSALFVDWRILENFNLFLDEVSIPIESVRSTEEAEAVFATMIREFRQNFSVGDWTEHSRLQNAIESDLDTLVLPNFVIDEIFPLYVTPEAHGTVFIIFDPHDQLQRLSHGDLNDVSSDEQTAYLRSSLSGIHNSFKDEHPFDVSFWIHDSVGNKYDLIASQNFFTHDDVISADHWVAGSFDETGFFRGEVRVFNRRLRHTFRSIRPPGETAYGPFNIEFGTVEGNAKNSMLPRERWDELNRKLEGYGGLYVYRDGFRVLPYGRPEYDFLRFEERRSRGAAYYMFSHRRLIGYIEISRERNSGLVDKAGREGFIANRAYREFQQDLIQFFVDLSVRYFRSTAEGDDPTIRHEQLAANKKRFDELERAEKRREKVTVARFKADLADKKERLGPLTGELRLLQGMLQDRLHHSTLIYNDIESLLSEIERVKVEIRSLVIAKPHRLSLPARHLNAYADYRDQYQSSLSVLTDTTALVEQVQARLTREDLRREFEKRYTKYAKDVPAAVRQFRKRFDVAARSLSEQIGLEATVFGDRFTTAAIELVPSETMRRDEVDQSLRELDRVAGTIQDEIGVRFEGFVRHVETLTFDVDEDLLVGWYKDQYKKIEERIEAMQELAQLGMAIEIIDHQFNVLYSEMSTSLRYYRQLAERQPETARSFAQLSRAFQHLETNHQLLTPLYRTTRRIRTLITGADIESYITEFFGKTFTAERISFTVDATFREYKFDTFESVIKPVFVNLVNNAIYWLIPAADRQIQIEVDHGKILVMNSGERIEEAYLDSIFGLFFSRRPNGRGIGLYLAKANLRSIGYDIRASNAPDESRLGGACFVIEKIGNP